MIERISDSNSSTDYAVQESKDDSSGNYDNSMDIQTEHETGSVGSLSSDFKDFSSESSESTSTNSSQIHDDENSESLEIRII